MEQINNEFQKIKTAMDRLVSRYADAPNAMQFPLDLGGQDIINVGKITAVDLEVGGIDLASQVQAAQDAADEAAGYASAAQAAVASAQGWANTASGFADDAEGYAQQALDVYQNVLFATIEEVASSFSVEDGDSLKVFMYTSGSSGICTLSSEAPTGTQIVVIQAGDGTVTFSSSDNILSRGGSVETAGSGAAVTCIKYSSGWYLGGQLVI